MLSTTRREPQRGQVIVLFAGALVVILLIAALVFDVGQNLVDRRAEQNAADASALAGARYLPGATYTYHGGCATAPGGMPAVAAACALAAENTYQDGVNGRSIRVDIPPIAPSTFAGLPGHIQVSVSTQRPSFFQGVIGVTTQRTGAMGVATNASDIALPYSLLALDPTGCGTNKITGARPSGISTDGTVHIDSNCSSGAVMLSGNGVLTAPQCDVVGAIQTSGGAINNCTTSPAGVLVSGDPLRNLPPPPQPTGNPLAVLPLDGGPIPQYCPGGSPPATDIAPNQCSFDKNTMKNKTYRIYPGNYPGGIYTGVSTVYMSPGIYWIGGGGISIKSTGGADGLLISKALGDNTGLSPSGGVLIYNTGDPNPAVAASCSTGGGGPGCYAAISLNGGAGANLSVWPIQSGDYKNMVVFVDRALAAGGGDDLDLNGGGSTLIMKGTVYVPTGTVTLNGSDSSGDGVNAQLICWSFQLNGSGGNLTLRYNPADVFHVRGTGLVQ